jgi:fumarate reductase flavoprotein subunit
MNVPADALAQTLDVYNCAFDEGSLQHLDVPRSSNTQPYAIRQLPLMAIPVCLGITYTMGGIEIDEHAQVLDGSQQPIPGLLAAGATTGGIQGGKGSAYIGGLIKAGCFGLLAAETVARIEGRPVSLEQPAQVQAVSRDEKPHGLARFPILSMVVRHGVKTGVVASLLVAALVLWLGWTVLSWFAVPIAIVVAAIALVVILGLRELVLLVTEFLMPE